MEKGFKKGEVVTAKKTSDGGEVIGEFDGYRLFNDEQPDSVVGVVYVPADGSYDVEADSIQYFESDNEKVRKYLIEWVGNSDNPRKEECLDYLEKTVKTLRAREFADEINSICAKYQAMGIFSDSRAIGFLNEVKIACWRERGQITEEEFRLMSEKQKPARWSEDDEKSFNNVLGGLRYAYEELINNKSFDSAADIKDAFEWMCSRFKGLIPQNDLEELI